MTEQDLTPTYEYTPRVPEHEGTRFDNETQIDLRKGREGLAPYEQIDNVRIGRQAINGFEVRTPKTVEVKLPPHVTYANSIGEGVKTLRRDALRQEEFGLTA